VVQILRYAVDVLRGQPNSVPANLRAHEAVWIIAHMVGDIHQPLHVGAIYFDKSCTTVVDPNKVAADAENFGIGLTVMETHGGGWLNISDERQLHTLWDREAVTAAMSLVGVTNGSVEDFARELIKSTPVQWQTQGDVASWSRQWANEILPLARDAHAPERLKIKTPGKLENHHGEARCAWDVTLEDEYDAWAAKRVQEQLTKAGFRLAAMLRAALGE
jgi:hypothetical protein